MKKVYKKPLIEAEPLEVEADYALVCSLSVGWGTIACLEKTSPNEYEELVYGLGLSPSTPIDSGVAYSNSSSCLASCYQGPYDTFFSS